MPAVYYECRSSVAYLTLAAPESGNVLSRDILDGIVGGVGKSNEDPHCRVIVLAALGSDFSKGMDLESLLSAAPQSIPEFCRDFVNCLETICRSSRPVIACVNGAAAGGGVGLLAACDTVVASEASRFMLPEVILGMIPALITPFLLQRMPIGRIRHMAVSSRSLTAAEAHGWGLIDEVAHPSMQEALDRQLGRLLRSSPEALAGAKTYLGSVSEAERVKQTDAALAALVAWLQRPGATDGIRAFANGFSPAWFEKYKGVG
jgi:enoyl-CoA hydratase/carnithine racemase